jgi:hypothetical protein
MSGRQRRRPGRQRRRTGGLAAVTGLAVAGFVAVAVAGCGSNPPPPAFHPGNGSVAAATPVAQPSGPGAVVMPPFGKDAHIVMTSVLPPNAAMARAALVDKDYELAYLYAEYTGGQSQDWTSYVDPTMEAQVRAVLSGADVTSESFRGTIRIFDLTVIRDPAVPGNVDVSACFDNAGAVNTDLSTGAVLPGQSPSDSNYYRYTDELAPTSAGQWQVVSDYPLIYYPRAKECKP